MSTESGITQSRPVSILPVTGIPEVQRGDDLESTVIKAIRASVGKLEAGDVVTVTHKIVSKSEGGLIDLTTITASPFATRFAEQWGKDPRHVEVVFGQARRIVRMVRGLIIAETHHGFVCANAGVDASNVSNDVVCVLPVDPDSSAESIRTALVSEFFPEWEGEDSPIGVIITDSFGRPWRNGIVNVAIGVAGVPALADYRGQYDPAGYELRASVLAIADELASAAELVMHKLAAVPVAVIRGYASQAGTPPGKGRDLVMPEERNLFP